MIRDTYKHICGAKTRIAREVVEEYVRRPPGGRLYCAGCGSNYDAREFYWLDNVEVKPLKKWEHRKFYWHGDEQTTK